MSKAIFVCYPRCTTCKKAEKWLADNGIAVQVRDIKEDNPTEQEIALGMKRVVCRSKNSLTPAASNTRNWG